MGSRSIWSVLLVATLLAVGQDASAGLDPLTRIRHDLVQKSAATSGLSATNGQFSVEVWRDGAWSAVDTLSFGQFYTHQRTRIPADGTHPVRIRIRQSGGGLAHIDALSLRGAASAVLPGLDRAELGKLLRSDNDVLDATRRELVADIVPTGNSVELDLHARVEPPQISTHRFVYPIHDRLGRDDGVHSTYRYRLGSRPGRLTPDGELQEVAQAEPFFSGFWPTGSGHPDGTTYGWVSDDGEFLYVAVDFTADNTLDGDKDYAAVIVRTAYGERTFRLSVNETDWGQVGFTYTPRVNYQHKVYEFRIPLAELGIEKPTLWQQLLAAAGLRNQLTIPEVDFAVVAYGTASPEGFQEPKIAFNTTDNEFLGVFERFACCAPREIWGQRYDKVGTVIGAPFPIAVSSIDSLEDPDVAYDSVNNRYLVVYTKYGSPSSIWGRLVSAAGVPTGAEFPIASGGQASDIPAVAFSATSQRFGIAWMSGSFPRDISGAVADTNGTVISASRIVNGSGGLNGPVDIGWSSLGDRFVIVYRDTSIDSTGGDIAAVSMATNGAGGTSFFVSDPLGPLQQTPVIAYDSNRNRFLVAFADGRNGNDDIYGQLVSATGTTYLSATTENVQLAGSPYDDENFGPWGTGRGQIGLDYDPIRDEFVVGFVSARPTSSYAYYQRVSAATLAPLGATAGANTLAATVPNPGAIEDVHVAANTTCGGFMLIFHELDDGSFPSQNTLGSQAAVALPCPPAAPAAPTGPRISVRSGAAAGPADRTSFGSVEIGTEATSTVIVSNSGDQNLTLGSVAVNDGLAAPFSVSADSCSSNTLQAGERCTVTVSFAPAATGTYSDQFDIPSNDPTATLTLWRVEGVGAAPGNNPPPVPRLIAPDDEAEIAGTSVEFIWASDPDPDGDPLTFELTYCTATDFTGCVPVEVTLPRETEQSKSTNDALEWSLLLGMGAVLVPLRRNLLAVTLIVALGAGVACNEKGLFEIGLGKNEVAYGFLATDLEPGSTYIWKVEALDGNGGRTPSETRTFTVK